MAQHRHRRETPPRRLPKATTLAGSLATLATAATVGVGVFAANPVDADPEVAAASVDSAPVPESGNPPERAPVVSRGDPRRSGPPIQKLTQADRMLTVEATRRAVAAADTRLWTTTALNLWTSPGEDAELVGEVEAGKRLLVTGRSLEGREEVVVAGVARWVTEGYLASEKPATLGGACTNGTSVPSYVAENLKKVHQAVCANFPEITVYGTGGGDSAELAGREVDIMVSGERGYQLAEFVRANAAELGVEYVIYAQRIWSVARSAEGWRFMPDRGSVTQNHYDHVHVTVY